MFLLGRASTIFPLLRTVVGTAEAHVSTSRKDMFAVNGYRTGVFNLSHHVDECMVWISGTNTRSFLSKRNIQ